MPKLDDPKIGAYGGLGMGHLWHLPQALWILPEGLPPLS